MPLTPTNQFDLDFGDIRFAMMDGDTKVVCTVTREALDDVEQGAPSDDERRERFRRHQSTIHLIASDLYDQGQPRPRVTSALLLQTVAKRRTD